MLNLLHNAYQHSLENTTITIRVLTETNSFTISVQDEGEGIPEEDIPHIFDRFIVLINPERELLGKRYRASCCKRDCRIA